MKKFFIISLSICATIWIISDAFLRYSNKTFSNAEIQKMFEPITDHYGIRIAYKVGDDFFSEITDPELPAGPDRSSKVIPIRHRVLADYPIALQLSFVKYPVALLKKHLNTIQFAGEIDSNGFKYGGTYDLYRKIIFLIDKGQKNKNQKMSTFHHEFSSILLRNYSFPTVKWTNQNPNNFKYLIKVYSTWEEMQQANDFSSEGKREYINGFLSVYGRTTFENDFNTYSAMIFTYPEKFKKIMSTYPRVREKFKIWLEFYHRIDPIFTEEYLLGGEY